MSKTTQISSSDGFFLATTPREVVRAILGPLESFFHRVSLGGRRILIGSAHDALSTANSAPSNTYRDGNCDITDHQVGREPIRGQGCTE